MEVRRGGDRLTVGGQRQLAVLTVLLLNAGRVVSLDRLVDCLWGERHPPGARAFFGVELRTAPILLVATYRDIEVHPTHPLVSTLTRLGYEPAVSRIALRGLRLAEVARFVAEATGVEPSAALVSALHQRTDGNPLFLGELTRLLQAENQLSPSAAVAATLPDEIRAVIGRRLADLPPTTFRLLEVAAVAGQDFDFEMVGAAQGLTPDRTLERLEAVVLTRLLTDDPAVPGRYRFTHPLVQEVLYTGLNRRRRTRVHHRIATTLQHIHEPGGGMRLMRGS